MKDELSRIRVSEPKPVVNHNETDYESFLEMRNAIEKSSERVNRKNMINIRKQNMLEWINSVPKKWSSSKLSDFPDHISDDLVNRLKSGTRSFYLYEGNSADRIALSYALGRKMIGGGIAKYSSFCFLTEETLMSLAKSGFEGKKQLDEIFSRSKRFYVLNGVSRDHYEPNRERPLMRRLIEHIYQNDLSLIITGSNDLDVFASNLDDASDIVFDLLEDGLVKLDEDNESNNEKSGLF